MKITISQAILDSLATENRYVLSMWRALIYLRRSSFRLTPNQRRWINIPEYESDISQYLRQMERNGEIQPIRGQSRLYKATIPYAQSRNLDEREVLFEDHVYTILSHFSALEFHGLTKEQPKVITAYSAAKAARDVLPLGTDASDWEGLALPSRTRPKSVLGRPVRWVNVDVPKLYGYSVYSPLGVPYRVTSAERTLIDALQKPDLNGGISNVLKAWVAGWDQIDPGLIVEYTDRFGMALLRQRVGYVLETLGYTSPLLNRWAASSKRGGSSKLVGSEPFATDYSERWNLSLNAPVHVLQDGVSA